MVGRTCSDRSPLPLRVPPACRPLHTGVSLRAAFLSVQQYGACEERLFPYEERTLKYSPNKGEAAGCADEGTRRAGSPGGRPLQPTAVHLKLLRCLPLLPLPDLALPCPGPPPPPPAEAYANAQLHRRKLLPIKLFASNGVDPRTRLYYVMAALARGHPIACGLKCAARTALRGGARLTAAGQAGAGCRSCWRRFSLVLLPRSGTRSLHACNGVSSKLPELDPPASLCCRIFKPRAERLGRGHGQGVVLNYPTPAELALEKGPDGRKVWGWHAVLLVGYDRKNHWFKFQNSWGSGWGQRGFFYTGVGYIASPKLSCDFWFFND